MQKCWRLSVPFPLNHLHQTLHSLLRASCTLLRPVILAQIAHCEAGVIQGHFYAQRAILDILTRTDHVQSRLTCPVLDMRQLVHGICRIELPPDASNARGNVDDACAGRLLE